MLGRHVAVVTIEVAHSSLGTAMESCQRWICNLDSSLLGGGQFLNETVSRTCGRLGGRPLVVGGHRLHDKVLVILFTASLHLNRLKLLLQAALLNVSHECWHSIVCGLHSVTC